MRSGPARAVAALILLGLCAAACVSNPPSSVGARVASSAPFETFGPSSDSTDVPLLADDSPPISPFNRAAQQPATLVRWPEKFWAKNFRITTLWSSPEPTAVAQAFLPEWSLLEFVGQMRQGRLLVRYPGDGRSSPPREAWVPATDVMVARAPAEDELPRAYPAVLQPDTVRIQVPYRTQLDNSPWAAANCGPTTLGMVLESIGVDVPAADLRREVLDAQGMWGDDVGVYMEALAKVAEQHGARVLDMDDGAALKRWSIEDVRDEVRHGHPVVLQVLFRALPERQDSPYWGDHFVVITGLMGDNFLYNDPVDSDGVGYDRSMTAAELRAAMSASDRRYAYAGFSIAKS
jgi:uncharacterized protein YvpB